MSEPTIIEYRRLRSPESSNSSLQIPPIHTADSLICENTTQPFSHNPFQFTTPAELKSLARTEILAAALQYTRRYRDIDFSLRDKFQIVASGHQPTLFHPGVWFKNFALSEIARRSNSIAINLIVDNDICNTPEINLPLMNGRESRFQRLKFDEGGDGIPFEFRPIRSIEFFKSFKERVEQAIQPHVASPIINRFWPLVVEQAKIHPTVGAAIAQGRHRLEADFGLETAEIPISRVAQTHAFAMFTRELVSRLEEFSPIYNNCLDVYRSTHGIRSSAHPVPPLESVGEFRETPFWVWDNKRPIRRSLFVRSSNTSFVFTNLREIQFEIPKKSFTTSFVELGDQGIAIRPKALMTTMFSRISLCDLFLHGIGGSKYDQLTDSIMQQFWGFQPPHYMTLTATMHLPINVKPATPTDISHIDVRLRELEFHPERSANLADQNACEIANSKRNWLAQQPPRGQRLDRHLAITECNHRLQPFVAAQREQLQVERAQLINRLTESRIANSREYSFCLFPESLPNELMRMAR